MARGGCALREEFNVTKKHGVSSNTPVDLRAWLPRILLGLVFTICVDVHASMFTAQLAYSKGDYDKAFKDYRDLAELGQPTAQFNLAVMYNNGKAPVRASSMLTRGPRLPQRTVRRKPGSSQTNCGRILRPDPRKSLMRSARCSGGRHSMRD